MENIIDFGLIIRERENKKYNDDKKYKELKGKWIPKK